MAEYHARLFMLEMFVPSSFSSERVWAAQFVLGLRIHIRFVVATFAYRTLSEGVMRAVKCEHAQESHHRLEIVVSPVCRAGVSGVRNIWAPSSIRGGPTRD